MSDTTLAELKENAIDELRDWVKDNPEEEPHDTISEITDSSVPVYNVDLLQLGSDNWELMTSESELGPAFDGSPTPINIIASNVYDAIGEALWKEWRIIEAEHEDCPHDCFASR